jgi:hypothetical protein
MSKMIQIRNVPDGTHRMLKARAAHAGMTLSDYLLAELKRFSELPTQDEMLARLRSRPAAKLRRSPTSIIRRERDSA